MDKLQYNQIKIGLQFLRNDVVSSRWLEDNIYDQEKVESVQDAFDRHGQNKFLFIQ